MNKKIMITNKDLVINGVPLYKEKGEINKPQLQENVVSVYIYVVGTDIFVYEDEFEIIDETEVLNTQ
jgi:hypothetical protein